MNNKEQSKHASEKHHLDNTPQQVPTGIIPLQKALKILTEGSVHLRLQERAKDSIYGEVLHYGAATIGERHREELLSQLEHSKFGQRFFSAYHRGGGYDFVVPLSDVEENRAWDWFSLTSPSPQPMWPMHNDPKLPIITKVQEVMAYDHHAGDTQSKIHMELREAIQNIVNRHGSMEEVISALQDGAIEAHLFTVEQDSIQLEAKHVTIAEHWSVR